MMIGLAQAGAAHTETGEGQADLYLAFFHLLVIFLKIRL